MSKSNNLAEIVLSYVSFMVIGMPGAILGVAWPSIQKQFGLALDAVAVLLLAGTIAYGLSSFFSGRVVSRLGMRWGLALGAAVSALGIFGYAFFPAWGLIIGSAAVAGLGGGLIDSGLNLHFARHYSPRLMNWLHAAFGLGAAIGPFLMTIILTSGQPWQLAYLIAALLQVVMSLGFIVVFHNSLDDQPTEEVKIQRASISIQETLRQPFVWLSVAMFFFYAGIEVTPAQWTFSLFTESRAIDVQTAGYWVSLYWWSFTIGRVFFGVVANRVPVNGSIRVCMALMIVGAGMMWWNPSNAVSFAGLAILGFALAPIFPLLISTTPERLGDAHATNAVGFQVAAASLGIGALPGMAGSLAVSYGLEIVPPFIAAASVIMFVIFQFLSTHKVRLDYSLAVEP